ncbi:hypothetical protein HDU93_004435, partial [Gonapodya sp. JEL0774]
SFHRLGGIANVAPLASQVLSYHVSPVVVDTAYLGANPISFPATLLGNSSLALIKPQVIKLEVAGGNVSINDVSNVIDTIVTSNGVIHVIDSVLIPPSNASTTLTAVTASNTPGVSFKQLAAALTSQSLLVAVDTTTPITIFAPLDSAFDALGKLLTPAQISANLKTVLTYHVIGGAAAYLPASGAYKTLQGENVTIVSNKTSVTVNGNPVLNTVVLTNGVVHVLGSVLVPPTIAAAISGNTTTSPTSASPAASSSTASTSPTPKAGSAYRTASNAVGLLAAVAVGLAMA